MVPGYRYGQSAAGRRIESLGAAYQEIAKYEDMLTRGGVLLRGLSERLEQCGESICTDLDQLRRKIKHFSPVHVILNQVALKYDTPVNEIISHRRARFLVKLRHEVMYRAVNETSASLPQIGRILNRDHTTIGDGVMKHCERTGDPLPRGMEARAYARKPQ